MRKLFTLLLAVAASIGTMFAEKVQIGDLYYYLYATSPTAEVTGKSGASGEIIIPASVEYNSVTYSVTSIGIQAFYECSSLTSVTIPNSVTIIGDYAFYGCNGLTSMTIPNSVTSIGNYAFWGCSGLTSVEIPNSVTSIGSYAFRGCSSLTSVTIPNSVTSIGDLAFYNCIGLTSVTIPDSVTSIGSYAFSGCSGLTSPVYNAHVFAFMPTSYSGAYTIPDGIESIAGGAFEGCSGLTSVTIPNSVTSIGNYAFRYCSGLTSVTIGNSVTSIGNYAFYKCSGLTSVTIPNSVTNIGNSAFGGCSGLTSVTIPNSVTSIGNDAFYDCSGLTSVTIPNSVTSIGGWAFRGCSSLTSVTIPNSVTSIGTQAFYGCSGLTSVTIPNSVTSIGEWAFYDCSITTLIVLATTPPSGGSACGINADNCTLYVPTESVNTYANTIWWEDFKEIKPLGDLICVQFVDWDGSLIARCYIEEGASAIAPANPTREGYTFIGWDKEFTNITEDLVVTAQYQINRYEVVFKDWDGTVLKSDSVDWNTAAIAPANPTREGYTFIGWDKEFSNVTEDLVVTAQYQINRFEVVFKDWDGTVLKSDSVDWNTAAIAPVNPMREGYEFIGWDKEFSQVTENMTITAQYELGENKTVTVIFANGNDESEILSQQLTMKVPSAPSISGFTFLGWYPVVSVFAEPENTITIQAVYQADVPSSAPEVYTNPSNPAQKLIRNGNVYILSGDKIYTIQGQEVK